MRKKRPAPPTELLVALFYAKPGGFVHLEACWMVDDTLPLPASAAEIRNWKAALGRPFPHRHKYVVFKAAKGKVKK